MDLDGTLIRHDGTLSSADIAAMRDASAAGIALAIVTGRRRSTFLPVRDRLGSVVFRASVSNGAVLLHADNDSVERVHELSWTTLLDAWNGAPHALIKACILITLPALSAGQRHEASDALILTPNGEFYSITSSSEPELHALDPACRVAPDLAMSGKLVHATFHVLDAAFARTLADDLARRFHGAATVFTMRPPRAAGMLVDVVVKGGKGVAVRDLAAHLGVAGAAIGAIGDDMNDALLLDAARFRYAVGESNLARRHAGAIEVRPRDAVADALDRFMRGIARGPL